MDIKHWQEKITQAQSGREEWAKQFKVKMSRDYFSGKQNPGYPANEWITVNLVYSHLMAQLPVLYSIDPYFYVKPKKSYTPDPKLIAEFESKGQVRQSMLNYLKGELKLKSKARLSIQDAHFAYGVIKTRFAAESKENPRAGLNVIDEGGQDLLDEEGQPIAEPDTVPVDERYEICRVHPDDFIWDQDSGPLEDDWNWLGERVRKTRDQALKDPMYKNAVIKDLSASDMKPDEKASRTRFKGQDYKQSNTQSDKGDDILIFYEIYDLKKKEWFIVPMEGTEYVKEPSKLASGVEDHPYSILRFTLMDDTPYPIPPISQGLDPQKEYNLSRSRMLTHRKRFNRKYEVNVGMLESEDELSNLENGDDGTIIRVMSAGAINPIKDAPLDQQNYLEINMLKQDMVETLGSPDSTRGVANADSATEAALIDKRLEVREGDRLGEVVDWLTDIAKKLDQIVQATITRDVAVKISGPKGENWEVVRVDDYEEINGEFEYSINTGSTLPRLPDIERAQFIAFFSQVVGQFPYILTSAATMKKVAQMFHIEDETMLEELRELGMKMMQGQIPTPGAGGSQPSENNPAASTIGAALGSLGGNNNGGGAQGGAQ